MSTINPYELLKISSSATKDEIKKAFLKQSRTCHPDKNPGDEKAAETFCYISRAKDILSDDDTRAVYDKYGWNKALEIASLKKNRENHVEKSDPIEQTVTVTLKQAYEGETISVVPNIENVTEKDTINIDLKKIVYGKTFVIEGAGETTDDHIRGDIYLTINVSPPENTKHIFTITENINVLVKLSTEEIANGYNIIIPYPNGNTYVIKGKYEDYDENGEIRLIFEDMGLYIRGRNGYKRGVLYVTIKPDYEDIIKFAKLAGLSSPVVSLKNTIDITNDCYTLAEYNEKQRHNIGQGPRIMMEGCAQQ